MEHIKNIIFDLGGVILNINYDLTKEAFVALGVTNFDTLYSKKKQENFFNEFEKGKISVADFHKELRSQLPNTVSDTEIDHAWNKMLGQVPPSRIRWLKDLKTQYRIFLLSNTNAIHIAAFKSIVEQQFGTDEFEEIFEKCYYSSNMGMRKPELEIFEFVINENSLKPEETLFIDDSIQHVEGGKVAGIHSCLLKDGMNVEALLLELGLT